MKKFIYISGVVIINIFVFGALFKIQHWPGSGILITLSLELFCFGFLPLAFIQSYIGNGRKHKSLYIAGFICAFITFIGAMFKIQHWSGAAYFLIVGIPLPFLYFLPVYIYNHNKSKEKSMLNFLGVMFMMVYVALFTSILSLNISKDILEAFNTGEKDIAQTNDILSIKNQQIYKTLETSCTEKEMEKMEQLKAKTYVINNQINDIKAVLVKAVEGSKTSAIELCKKISTNAIWGKDESSKTTVIMRGDDGTTGSAVALKKQLGTYCEYLKSFTCNNSDYAKRIEELLNTADFKDTCNGENRTVLWEDDFFPNGAYLVTILCNLNCIETNVKIAEGEALESLAENFEGGQK